MKKYIKLFLFFLVFINIISCSGSKYPYDKPLNMVFDRNIRLNYNLLPVIPEGWFVANTDSLPDNIILLLIENNYRSFISLSEFKISKLARELINKKGLKELALLSIELKNEKTNNNIKICSDFLKYSIDDKDFIVYDYMLNDLSDTARTIIFRKDDNYYELTAIQNNENKNRIITRDSVLIVQFNVFKKIL